MIYTMKDIMMIKIMVMKKVMMITQIIMTNIMKKIRESMLEDTVIKIKHIKF